MNKIFQITLFLLSIMMFSCKQQNLKSTDYVKWVEEKDNGIRVEKEIEEYKFTVQYSPIDYLIIKDLYAQGKEITEKLVNEERKLREGEQYYLFQIAMVDQTQDLMKYNITDISDYEKRVNYFSFNIQNDLKLIDGNDTLDCKLHHFEQSYGLAPYITIGAVFDEKKENKNKNDKIFIYQDKILNTGTIKITIKDKSINNIPKLSI